MLQHFLDQLNQWPSISYQVITMGGSKLWKLWSVAKSALVEEKVDRAHILGGICNITSPTYHQGICSFWPRKRINYLAAELVQCQIDIYEDITINNLKGKVILLPEFGGDLIRYNNVDVPSSWMLNCQHDFYMNLPLIHKVTKDINKCMGVRTPWSLDVIYRQTRSGIRYPKYDLLIDGVHFTEETSERVAAQILKDVDEFFGSKVIITSTLPLPLLQTLQLY